MGKHTELPWREAVDHELMVCHLGTADSYDTAQAAVKDLCLWHQEVGAYFAKEEVEANHARLVEALREVSGLDQMSMENAVGWLEDNCQDIRTLLAQLDA